MLKNVRSHFLRSTFLVVFDARSLPVEMGECRALIVCAVVCTFCRSRTKLNKCCTSMHVDGYLLTDICIFCKSTKKNRNCRIMKHVDGFPFQETNDKLVIVDRLYVWFLSV